MKFSIYQVRRPMTDAKVTTFDIPDDQEVVAVDIDRDDLRVFVITKDVSPITKDMDKWKGAST